MPFFAASTGHSSTIAPRLKNFKKPYGLTYIAIANHRYLFINIIIRQLSSQPLIERWKTYQRNIQKKKSLAHVPSNCLPHYRLIKEVAKRPYLRVIPITYIPWRFILNWYSWTSLIFCCLRYPPPPPPSSIPKWLLTDWPWRRWSYTRRRRAGIALCCTSAATSRAAATPADAFHAHLKRIAVSWLT